MQLNAPMKQYRYLDEFLYTNIAETPIQFLKVILIKHAGLSKSHHKKSTVHHFLIANEVLQIFKQ